MRQIVLDTETTGLDPGEGHRIIEIGCVDLVNRRVSERRFHYYLCPDRDIDHGAVEVHGITLAQLKDSPRFADIAKEFLDFIRGAELIIHNAAFDVGFINSELKRLGPEWGRIDEVCAVIDTLTLARELHPGQKNSLDALCKRYQIDNSARIQHGALLDAEILADVYLAITGGQADLLLDDFRPAVRKKIESVRAEKRPPLPVIVPSEGEWKEHCRLLEIIDRASDGRCLWRREQTDDVAVSPLESLIEQYSDSCASHQ